MILVDKETGEEFELKLHPYGPMRQTLTPVKPKQWEPNLEYLTLEVNQQLHKNLKELANYLWHTNYTPDEIDNFKPKRKAIYNLHEDCLVLKEYAEEKEKEVQRLKKEIGNLKMKWLGV